MDMSTSIDQIAVAMAKAQAEVKGATKDSENKHFGSNYADLAAVKDACFKALNDNGISVVQSPEDGGKEAHIKTTTYNKKTDITTTVEAKLDYISVTTLFIHTSGQWIKGTVSCAPKEVGAQAVGSAITYLRRYALAAFAGVAPEDDDGNGADDRKTPNTAQNSAPPPKQATKSGTIDLILSSGEVVTLKSMGEYFTRLEEEIKADPNVWFIAENEAMRKKVLSSRPEHEARFNALEALATKDA